MYSIVYNTTQIFQQNSQFYFKINNFWFLYNMHKYVFVNGANLLKTFQFHKTDLYL